MRLDLHMRQLGFIRSTEDTARENPMACFKPTPPLCGGRCWVYDQPDDFALMAIESCENENGHTIHLYADGLRILCEGEHYSVCCVACQTEPTESILYKIPSLLPLPVGGECVKIARHIIFEASAAYLQQKLGETFHLNKKGTMPDHTHIAAALKRRFREIRLLLQQAVDYRGFGTASRLYFDAKATELMAYLAEEELTLPCKRRTSPCRLCDEDQVRIQHVAHYLSTNIRKEFDLDMLCHIACMGRTKLKKTFRVVYCCTLTQYLQQQRMKTAQCLLCDAQCSIAQVAQAVSYRAGGRFASAFRQTTGMLPREYRLYAILHSQEGTQ